MDVMSTGSAAQSRPSDRMERCEDSDKTNSGQESLCADRPARFGEDRLQAAVPRVVSGRGMVGAQTADAVCGDVHGIRQVPAHVRRHSDLPRGAADGYLRVEFRVGGHLHRPAFHRGSR